MEVAGGDGARVAVEAGGGGGLDVTLDETAALGDSAADEPATCDGLARTDECGAHEIRAGESVMPAGVLEPTAHPVIPTVAHTARRGSRFRCTMLTLAVSCRATRRTPRASLGVVRAAVVVHPSGLYGRAVDRRRLRPDRRSVAPSLASAMHSLCLSRARTRYGGRQAGIGCSCGSVIFVDESAEHWSSVDGRSQVN